jgi:hypothetical protein
MNQIIIKVCCFFLLAPLAFADRVNFTFSHIQDSETGSQPVYAFFHACKIGATPDCSHLAEAPERGLAVGETAQDDVISVPVLAPDPSGAYRIYINCGKQHYRTQTSLRLIRAIPRNGEVLIQASCPVDKNGDFLAPKYHIEIHPK